MFSSPFIEQEKEQKLRILFYNVEMGTFTFLERRCSQNVEYENENVSHVPVPRLPRFVPTCKAVFKRASGRCC
jgi:hypothetical protein